MAGLIVIAALIAALISAALSDLLTMTIPNKLTLIVVALFPIAVLAFGLDATEILLHVSAGVLILVVFFAFFAFGWMGGGDVKLAGGVGLWLGFELLLPWLLITSVLGGALTLFILFARRLPLPAILHRQEWALTLHTPQTGIPYGIAISAGSLAVLTQSSWVKLLS